MLTIGAGGIAGSVVDTLLGAGVQERRICPRCGQVTEQTIHGPCGGPTRFDGGIRGLDNDWVNALACACAALLAGALWAVLTTL